MPRPASRSLVVLLLLSVLAAACSRDASDRVELSLAPTTTATAGSAGAEPDGAVTTAERSSSTTHPRQLTSTTAGGSGTSPATVASTAPQQAMVADGSGPPGSFARTLLRPEPMTSIVVEVVAQATAVPPDATRDAALRALNQATGKPTRSVTVTVDGGAASTQWDEESLLAFADTHSRESGDSNTAAIKYLSVRGSFRPDANAIGVAIRGDVFAVFADKVEDASTTLVFDTEIERAVVVHELGHLLGLVDIALNRNRADPEHPFHSKNPKSVMYWAIDTGLVTQVLAGPPPSEFDADDRADLAALREGQ